MPLINFTAGAVPTESDLDTVSRQSVIAGNSAPSGPSEGMVWYDTNAAHPLLYVYNGTDWWPLPAGLIAKSSVVDTGTVPPYNIGASEVTINGTELTFTAENDQRYAYEVDFIFMGTDVDELFEITPQTYNGSTWSDADESWKVQVQAVTTEQRESIRFINGPGAGSTGFRLRISRFYGTGSAQIIGGTDASVMHIGSSTLV